MVVFVATPGRAARGAVAALALAALLCWPLGAWAVPSLSPQPLSAHPGDSFTLTLTDDFMADNDIGAFDLKLSFDQTLLVLTGVANAAALNQPLAWTSPTFNPAAGIDFALISVSPDCDFITLTCSVVPPGNGQAVLNFTFDVLPGATAGPTVITAETTPDYVGFEGEYQLEPVSATLDVEVPHPVPAPGAGALVLPGLALAGMLAFRRRRHAA